MGFIINVVYNWNRFSSIYTRTVAKFRYMLIYLIIYIRKKKNHLYLMRLLTIINIVLYIKLHH